MDFASGVSDADGVHSLYDPVKAIVMADGQGRRRAVEAIVRHYDLAVDDVLNRLKEEFDTMATPVQTR